MSRTYTSLGLCWRGVCLLLLWLATPNAGHAQEVRPSSVEAGKAAREQNEAARVATIGPDLVRQRDGAEWRGTIVQRNASRVTMVTFDGATKSFESWTIDYAGPAGASPDVASREESTVSAGPVQDPVSAPPQETSTASVPPRAALGEVELRLNPAPGDTIHLDAGGGLKQVCSGPCVAKVAPGFYRTGISRGGRSAVASPGTWEIAQDDELRGAFLSRRKQRILGGLLLGLGVPAGAGVMAAGFYQKDLKATCEVGGNCVLTNDKVEPTLIAVGAVVALASAIAGGYLVAQKDRAFVHAKRARVLFNELDAPGPEPLLPAGGAAAHLDDRRIIEANRERVKACTRGDLRDLTAHVDIDASGAVSKVTLETKHGPTMRDCIAAMIEDLRFATGKPRRVDHRF